MKIVKIDNYNRETHNDATIVGSVNRYYGEKIVNLLNNDPKRNDEDYFRLVNDDYKLYRFEP